MMPKKTPPPPVDAALRPGDRPRLTDEQVLGALDACLELKPLERSAVTSAMAKFVDRGSLARPTRDHMMAIARAHKLFASTETRAPRRHPSTAVDGGDNFSVRRTDGTIFAERLLSRPLPKRPPGRSAA